MTTPETATSINHRRMEQQLRRQLLSTPETQWEAIAKHYMAHANIAKQLKELLWCRHMVGPTKDGDYCIAVLVDTIKANHLRDFGIELEWPQQEIL